MNSRDTIITAIFLAFAILLAAVHHHLSQPPAPIGRDAPSKEFSAQRANDVLSELLQENQPHPVGSKQNRLVRERIEQHLRTLGITYRIQATWSCRYQHNRCAPVENIIAKLPGKSDNNQIAVMAHYDSVPTSPGAGDDGMAVAAMLESARALTSQPIKNKTLILLFTDGEETGLLGAEAFFNEAPEAKHITTVLNFEGSGTRGVSRLLRTSLGNAELVSALGDTADPAIGSSISQEIFKRMPNDTDFSTVLRHGKQGMDFAFAEERNHYHTRNDNLANIDMRTLQHHGNNMLPMLERLLKEPTPKSEAETETELEVRDLTYTNFYGMWLTWPTAWQLVIAAIAIALLILSTVQYQINISSLLAGSATALAILVLSSAACFAGFRLIELSTGSIPSWPDSDTVFRLYVLTSIFTTGAIIGSIAARFSNHIALMLGAWYLISLLTLALAIWLPMAANNWIVALLPASVLIFLSSRHNAKTSSKARPTTIPKKMANHHNLLIALTMVCAIPPTLGLFLPIETSQGYTLLPALFPSIGVFTMLFVCTAISIGLSQGLKNIGIASLAVVCVAAILAINSPLYSEQRPRLLNLYHFADIDNQSAWLTVRSSTNIDPQFRQSMTELGEWQDSPKQLLPFSTRQYPLWAQVPYQESAPLSLQKQVKQSSRRKVEFTIQTLPTTAELRWYWPSNIALRNFRINDKEFLAAPASTATQFSNLTLAGAYQKPLRITLVFESNDEIEGYFASIDTEPPNALAHIIKARGIESAPVHQGDQAVSFRLIKF